MNATFARNKQPSKKLAEASRTFFRYHEITSDKVAGRMSQLSGVPLAPLKEWMESQVSYGRMRGNTTSDEGLYLPFTGVLNAEQARLWALNNILILRQLYRPPPKCFWGSFSLITRIPNIDRLFLEIATEPSSRANPYDKGIHDNPGGFWFVDGSFGRDFFISLGIALAAYNGLPNVVSSIEQTAGKGALISSVFAVPIAFTITKNIILRLTWESHVYQTYAAVERYGVDGYLAMMLKPTTTLGIMRRLDKLEKKRLLAQPAGFTTEGAEWFRKQASLDSWHEFHQNQKAAQTASSSSGS